ncbi:SPOR domain-containing protein [Pseudoponticoccus marisrubri]|uniref:Sporulation domain-containing protein n=1 Tax=Pseudoponticoccus marisrubri TaxID=1685382 RepID=A0A0W7WDQ1_9RHOB|nr:SPOR domain-containing protein [Pseudoponticoccus marisrubri]KUF08694.1 sporulation domain-containing protein [Pseudoponticoccus marisrubri]
MSGDPNNNRSVLLRNSVAGMALLSLAACADGQMPGFLKSKEGGGSEVVSRASSDGLGTVTERDIEAPEIFQATEAGLWDGRPSLGGVWVAHPDVEDPERAIIRNEQNGKFVVGALFRRERQSPGPRLQVSSDAAAALGVLAGQPTNLDVVALRREEVAPEPAAVTSEDGALADQAVPAAAEVSEGTLEPVAETSAETPDPVAAGAARALETAALAPATPRASAPAKPQPAAATAPAPRTPALEKPFIQIGIFSVQSNAENTATAMRQAGMVPTVKTHTSQGKKFWRVVVGPARTKDELSTLLKTIKGTGFTDAYAVTD